MTPLIYDAADEAATARLGQILAGCLPDGAVVALNGTLGAGKTRLVQTLAQAAGVANGEVTSPTFVLVNEYQGRRAIYHFDAYRLRGDDEFYDLGAEEYFARRGLVLIEWGERVVRCLPPERFEIQIEPTGPTSRRFTLTAYGAQNQLVVETIASRLASS